MHEPKIVVIGGGTGSFTLLQELKKLTSNITALVNMADDGGSTGILRDELGVLPPGDVRQCLVALSDASQELRNLFDFRFGEGTLAGHSFGNLFLSATEKMTDNFEDAVRLAGEVLRIRGEVIPITLTNSQLVMTTDGKKIVGEYKISLCPLSERPKLALEPRSIINPAARARILAADLVVIAPGNLYGSLAPALLVDGVAEALTATRGKVAFVCNLVNKQHQTTNFVVNDYAGEVERFTHPGVLDYVFYNTDRPSDLLIEQYALEEEYPVEIDEEKLKQASYKAIGGAFLFHGEQERDTKDTRIKRSFIRHDAKAIAHALGDLIG